MQLAITTDQSKRVFVGIDVHKKSYSVCVASFCSESQYVRLPADPGGLIRWLKKGFPGFVIESVYEAGFSGFGLHRLLTAAGIANRVVNPASIPVAANCKVKTDKRDARRLSELLRAGELRGIFVPPVKDELARLLPRTRDQLVEARTRFGNQIKSKLTEFSFIDGDDDRRMSLKLLAEFESMDLPDELAACLKLLGNLYRATHQQILQMEKQLEKQAAQDSKREAIYRSVPGVGPSSSRTLSCELGDMKRFKNERQLFSYTGLTPSENSSGEKNRKGGITRQGNTHVRHCLVEAAWRAIGEDSELRKRYDRLKLRCGGKRAIVAIARQLVGRIRACLAKDEPYRMAAVA